MKINKIAKIASLLIIALTIGLLGFTQIPDEIILSIKSGNAKTLSGFFSQNIELVILDNDDVYSKSQAEQIVAAFFKENQPDDFRIIHQGGKTDSKYVIGNLETENGTFRTYFLLKRTEGNTSYIHQLRIEKQE